MSKENNNIEKYGLVVKWKYRVGEEAEVSD